MAKIDDNVRRFVVQQLACYDTPTQVAEAVKEEFDGLVITRMQVASYDPTKHAAKGLAKKWRDLFTATRAKFLDDVSQIPIANQAARLRSLERLLRQAEKNRNAPLAAQLLEQAAKEVGGAYTDRRRIIGDPNAPIPVQHAGRIDVAHMHTLSDAELERIAGGSGRG
jgi:hypothetical protein